MSLYQSGVMLAHRPAAVNHVSLISDTMWNVWMDVRRDEGAVFSMSVNE
jgi:hypothetical protein